MNHLRLLPTVPTTNPTETILQSASLVAAMAWTPERGWEIGYYVSDLPESVQGEAWRAHYFAGGEEPVTTSAAPGHPALCLLGPEQRLRVWSIARKVLGELERSIADQLAAA